METTTSSGELDSATTGEPSPGSAELDLPTAGAAPAAGSSAVATGPAGAGSDGTVDPVSDNAPQGGALNGDAVPGPEREVDPEREGDVAADYLEELLDIADLDGDIDLDVEGDRAVVSLVGGDLEVLVGPQGSVLEALQELTRLAVLRSTGHRSRLLLDVDGWRARRRDQIRLRATDAVATARSTGEPVALPPMSAYERKVVHDVVAELGLVSASDGEDPHRHVVIRTA